jgi:trans-2,3-dihydro-3-hydroxyanthranilate isomerase
MAAGGGLRVTWLDVFTATPLAGNALAVVQDADGLDDAAMLRFARETRLSETTFVQAPTRDGADYRNRIWMMSGELPFAGHPSLGTAVAVAYARREREARYVQETGAGLQPLEVELAGRHARASMLQEPAVFGAELDPAEALAPLGLQASDAHPDLPSQVVSTGVRQLIVPVRDARVLERLAPEREPLRALLDAHGAITVYLAACDPAAGTASARAYFPDLGAVGEDPATGSAAGPLCAYLQRRTGASRVRIEQGVAMGRPSVLECSMEGDRVRVGGDVVVVVEGSLHL